MREWRERNREGESVRLHIFNRATACIARKEREKERKIRQIDRKREREGE